MEYTFQGRMIMKKRYEILNGVKNEHGFMDMWKWMKERREKSKDLSENMNRIPKGVVVLKTDYDSEQELTDKYGVTYQHTFVVVDSEGNEIKKWNGGGINQLVDELATI